MRRDRYAPKLDLTGITIAKSSRGIPRGGETLPYNTKSNLIPNLYYLGKKFS